MRRRARHKDLVSHQPSSLGLAFGKTRSAAERSVPVYFCAWQVKSQHKFALLTVSNHAAINVAKALFDRGVPGFELGMSRSGFDIGMHSGNRDLIKLRAD